MDLKPLAEWDLSKETGWERQSAQLYAVSTAPPSLWGKATGWIPTEKAISFTDPRYFRLDVETGLFEWFDTPAEVPARVDEAGNLYYIRDKHIWKFSPTGELRVAVAYTTAFADMAVSDSLGITLWLRDYHISHIIHFDQQGQKQWEIPLAPTISSCQLAHTERGISAVLASTVLTYIELDKDGACCYWDRIAPFDIAPIPAIQTPPTNFGYMMTQATLIPAPSLSYQSIISYTPALPKKGPRNFLIRCHANHRTEAVPITGELRSFAYMDAERIAAIRGSAGHEHLVLFPHPDWRKARTPTQLSSRWRSSHDQGLWR
jgi:hypothetical protein